MFTPHLLRVFADEDTFNRPAIAETALYGVMVHRPDGYLFFLLLSPAVITLGVVPAHGVPFFYSVFSIMRRFDVGFFHFFTASLQAWIATIIFSP